MKNIRQWMMTALGCALLAACGGGDPTVPGSGTPAGAPTTKGNFTALIVFGDSLSDVGTYAPVTSATGDGKPPYIGGKFTTNSATGTIWIENIATTLGLLVTPAEAGWGAVSGKCPVVAVNPALAPTCTGYGQGGSRVTNPDGIGHDGGKGALTVPVKTQIANHLAKAGGFKDSDLIFVFAGNNDVFVQFGTFAASAAQIQADAAAGKYTADQANNLLLQAQLTAQEGMKEAAVELSAYIRTEILAKGGKYVVVFKLSDIAQTPFGQTVPAAAQPVLTTMSQIFNLWLTEGMTNQPVQLVDTFTLFRAIYANPGAYGITNAQVPTCDADKISVITGGQEKTGSSLFCNSTAGAPYNGMRTGADANTWFFADSVHPTTGGHKIFSDEMSKLLKSYGWI